jgi:hypothetical protein
LDKSTENIDKNFIKLKEPVVLKNVNGLDLKKPRLSPRLSNQRNSVLIRRIKKSGLF